MSEGETQGQTDGQADMGTQGTSCTLAVNLGRMAAKEHTNNCTQDDISKQTEMI